MKPAERSSPIHQEQPNENKALLAAWLVTLAAGFCCFSYVTADPDLWGHVLFGRDTWAGGGLHATDPYSFTSGGRTWINHEWLCELAFYFTWNLFGGGGLLAGKLLMGLLTLSLMFAATRYRARSPLAAALALPLAACVMGPGYMVRPQVFSFFFFAVFVASLHAFYAGKEKALWLPPLATLFWVNLHGGFLMGLALIFSACAWEAFAVLFLKARPRRLALLAVCLAGASLLTLVNPYGPGLHAFLKETLSAPRSITEWSSFHFLDLSFPAAKTLMALVILVFALNRKQNRGWEAAGLALTLYAGIRHQRHLPFFAILAGPYLVWGLTNFFRNSKFAFHHPGEKKILTRAAWAAVGALFLWFMGCGILPYAKSSGHIIVDPDTYPVGAVKFLKTNRLSGNLLVPFDWGEYAIWKLYPDFRVSVDGRFRTVYPEQVLQDHFPALNDSRGWQKLLDAYPADVVLARQIPFFQKLIAERSVTWVYAYSDAISIVFLKNNEKNQDAIKRLATGKLTYPDEGSLDLIFP